MKVLTDNKYYSQIADVIREQNGTSNTYKPQQMVRALKDLFYEEVEGVPPISFNGIGENLLDYRIDGASGGVGDRTSNLLPNPEVKSQTESGVTISRFANGIITIKGTPTAQMDVKFNFEESTFSAGSYIHLRNNFSTYNFAVSFRKDGVSKIAPSLGKLNSIQRITEDITVNQMVVLCNNNAVGTNYDITIQPSIELTNEDTSYEAYGYKVPVVVSGKNLLSKLPYSRIDKGIEYTNVNNLYLHIEGTSNAVYSQTNSVSLLFKKGKYYINFYCDEQYKSKLFVLLRNNNNTDIVNVYSSGASFELNNDETIKLIAGVKENNTTINTNMYIQIVSGITSQSTYEPYIEPTTTNIYLDNPIRTVEDEVEYIDYSEQKQHRVRKNLLQNTATTQTINGVTFTVNNDKSITCNGTATANTIFKIVQTPDFPDNEDMLFTGCPVGGSSSTYQLQYSNNRDKAFQDMGNGIVLQKMDYNTYPNTYVQIRIIEGYTCNNLTFYPMIRKADIEDDTYEPYIENTEVDVTLPAIPTIEGTNVITIDTTVQPNNVYIKSRHESSYETAMRERYEEAQAQLDALN